MAKLTDEQKLRRLVRRSIEARKNFLDKPDRADYRHMVYDFLEKFILCEVGTKKVLNSYYKKRGDEKTAEDINMPINDIKNALTEAGYDISSMELSKMFKKNNLRGSKSARDLRNSIAHDMSPNDIQELIDRYEEINLLLDGYLSVMTSEPLD